MVTIEEIKEILDKVDFVYLVKDSSDIYYVMSPAQVARRGAVESVKITKADIGDRTVLELFVPEVKTRAKARKNKSK